MWYKPDFHCALVLQIFNPQSKCRVSFVGQYMINILMVVKISKETLTLFDFTRPTLFENIEILKLSLLKLAVKSCVYFMLK